MHVFDYRFLRDYSVSPGILDRVSRLESFKERSGFLKDGRGSVLRNMESMAIVMSSRDSNAIEGIRTADDRLFPLLLGGSGPRSRSEEAIMGYRHCLGTIHAEHDRIGLSSDSVLSLYGTLMSTDEPRLKDRDNVIIERSPDGRVISVHETVPFDETEDALREAILSFDEARNDSRINDLILIPCFIVDFLRIHPFIDGNGRMSRLLTALLLYQSGYDICRYVSLESRINISLNDYYSALEMSEIGWFDNESDYTPFIDYFLGILFLAYREYDRRLSASVGVSGKADAVRDIVMNVDLPISKREIMEVLPDASESTVEAELRRLLSEGSIEKKGSTRNARYIRKDAFWPR